MDIKDLQCITHSPIFSTYYKTHHSWEKTVLIWRLSDFASAVFHKSAILLIFEKEFTESVLNILLYPASTLGPTMVWPKEKFQNEGASAKMVGKY